MTEFLDIELVSVVEAEFPEAFSVAFDVIYPGETWCRSVIDVGHDVAGRMAFEERAAVSAARDALLELLVLETGPVSFRLRLSVEGTTIVDKGRPGPHTVV